jgi:hypothetical protein
MLMCHLCGVCCCPAVAQGFLYACFASTPSYCAWTHVDKNAIAALQAPHAHFLQTALSLASGMLLRAKMAWCSSVLSSLNSALMFGTAGNIEAAKRV